jgi:hypothetical protein
VYQVEPEVSEAKLYLYIFKFINYGF